MTTNPLRYILVCLATTLAGAAKGDTIYMFSRPDGTVHFAQAPAAVPFSSYHRYLQRQERRRSRPVGTVAPGAVSGLQSGRSRYEFLVAEVARSHQLDSDLLHAVIAIESRYDPKALSPMGAAGLMQLMPATARRYGVENVLDPEQNLHGGARYLRDLLSTFGSDVRLALAAYHAGEHAVVRHRNSIPPVQSTMDFVSRVLDLYHRYRAGSGR